SKTIILIAYYFPPIGMGGVGRPYALYRYLPDYGYNVIVLTVKDILYPQYDYSMLSKGDEQNIYRCGSIDPARVLHLMGKRKQKQSGYPNLTRKLPLYFPDLKRGWTFFAQRKLKKLIQEKDISAVITTAPPPSVHLLGLTLKKISKTPWVADFRDYWLPLPVEDVYPDGIMKKYSLKLKDEMVSKADEVISINKDIKRYLGRGEVIMNGTDNSVVEQWKKPHKLSKDKLVIGALGTFNHLCPIEPLFEAVRSLIDNNKIPETKIQIIHAGFTDDEFDNLVNKYRLNRIVLKEGYLERQKAIEALLPGDILYLAVSKLAKYSITTGRIFDYLVSGKPVLGLVPENSDAADLLDQYPHGTTITDYDIQKVIGYLNSYYDKKMANASPAPKIEYETDKFTMSALAKKYTSILDRLTE
ncbi:MAG: glycosyltransferase family 4 protein, partial [candidate division Zixibacteria bacterium]|nr:glycosyltransferase family 4 protein [candidate division Zixibacteria bacterium]